MIDLKATNEKLKDRAIRIVSQIADVNMAEALEMLMHSNWEIKTSIVALVMGVDAEKARELLKKNSGVLRKVI